MNKTVAQYLAERARLNTHQLAVVSDEGQWSWGELADISFRLSTRLKQEGVAPGDRVALLAPNSVNYLATWFAITNLGAIAVTVNVGLKGDPLRHAVAFTQPSLIVIEENLLAEKKQDLDSLLDEFNTLVFSRDDGVTALIEELEATPAFNGHSGSPLSIVFTSGTTGLPKGVLNCHEAYLESGRLLAKRLNIVEQDRILVMLPLFHANPQVYAVMTALVTGCSLIIRPKFSASKLFDDARRFQATLFTYVGTILAMLINKHPQGDRNHSLTRCVGGGCTLQNWQQIQSLFDIDPYELYGMSETAGWISANGVGAYKKGSCGKIRDDIEVMIADEQDYELPSETVGEILIRPRLPYRILLEYWDNAAANHEVSRNFWFDTGDLGYLDQQGYLHFTGRSKEIVRKGGENISPAELEAQILRFPKVKDTAVVAVPDPILGDEIKVCIVANTEFPAHELVEFLAPRVAKFMLPRYIQFLSEIPRTETEKIIRKQLQDNNFAVHDLSLASLKEN